MSSQPKSRSPWAWVPTLYFFEGVPYSIVMITSGLVYKTMGVSVASLAFWTSLLYLPWTLKFLWGPYIDVLSTKRKWVVWTQLILGVSLIAVGLVMPLSAFYSLSLIILAVVAISSASHDIAADGFYMYALDQHNQAFFVGIRSTFYRLAKLTALGLLPVVAGLVMVNTGLKPLNINVSSVDTETYVPFDPSSINISSVGGKPDILVFPENPEIPLYQAGKSELDSVIVYIVLSSPPVEGETVVVNIARKTGSKDIDIPKKQSVRFEFNSLNWDKPVTAVIKVNHNLKDHTSAGFQITAGNVAFSWLVSLGTLGILLLILALYNKFALPHPVENTEKEHISWKVYWEPYGSFFKKPGVIPALMFFLLYRFGEAQLFKIATPFLVDARNEGGIGMSASQYGIVYGTVGVICLMLGGIIGGLSASRFGLKKTIWIMALAMNVPISVYIYLAWIQPMPDNILISIAIAIEQFGYGFGFTAYMLYILHYVGESKYKTAEYAIATSFMALGMMLPGLISGKIQEALGYQHFFIYVIICAIPGLIAIKFLKIDPAFGIKKN
jgi:PAT family beta-lactamase induction signal transducer AmpG